MAEEAELRSRAPTVWSFWASQAAKRPSSGALTRIVEDLWPRIARQRSIGYRPWVAYLFCPGSKAQSICTFFNHRAGRGCVSARCTREHQCLFCGERDHGLYADWLPTRRCPALERYLTELQQLAVQREASPELLEQQLRQLHGLGGLDQLGGPSAELADPLVSRPGRPVRPAREARPNFGHSCGAGSGAAAASSKYCYEEVAFPALGGRATEGRATQASRTWADIARTAPPQPATDAPPLQPDLPAEPEPVSPSAQWEEEAEDRRRFSRVEDL
jgi:hypothetical protein